jgi:hypothetical protein
MDFKDKNYYVLKKHWFRREYVDISVILKLTNAI